MAQALLTKSNLFTQSWENLYVEINTRTNVRDPFSAGVRKFIYSREPNTKSNNFAGFPFIVMPPDELSFENPSVSTTKKDTLHTQIVEVYSSDNLLNGTINGVGQTYLNQISDDLVKTFNDLTVKARLRGYKIENINIKTTGVQVLELEEETVFVRSFLIEYSTRMVTG